ncbi:MAG: phosphodiester glycosidase family protein [Oscillospiraceae bacterium]|nr:phosphodiester glycosidase family protein [Oscillospiraceae bacterium]
MKRIKLASLLYFVLLLAFTAYVLLDALVIPRAYQVVPQSMADTSDETAAQSTALNNTGSSTESETDRATETAVTVTDTSYDGNGISITITTYREYDTNIYVADITLESADSLQTAFAQSTYGKNITETASSIASDVGAILAINGDYYGVRSGYVIRNGVLYRNSSSDDEQQDLVIWADGSCSTILEGDVTAEELLAQGAQQVLSFGPALLTDGEVSVGTSTEVDKSMTSNPRTAIGVIDSLHYVMVVSDGRTSESEGLSLYQLAEFMQTLGVQTAYNLDGGGSSTMVFCGTVLNDPTTDGRTIKERSVSDIVYIG